LGNRNSSENSEKRTDTRQTSLLVKTLDANAAEERGSAGNRPPSRVLELFLEARLQDSQWESKVEIDGKISPGRKVLRNRIYYAGTLFYGI